MDDDDVQESIHLGGQSNPTSPTPKTTTQSMTPSATTPPAPTVTDEGEDEAPPTKPPRPLTEAQKNEAILKEAFPSVDQGVIRAVLSASGGRVEPAFNALLGTFTL